MINMMIICSQYIMFSNQRQRVSLQTKTTKELDVFDVTILPHACLNFQHDYHPLGIKMNLIKTISNHLQLPENKVNSTVELLKEKNTIPFIARYRKERTGNLDEVQIRNIQDELQRLENLDERRQSVLQSIQEQGKLTNNLKDRLLHAETLTALEDLYQPYRPKRRTKAMIAREKGLEPLAKMLLQQPISNESIKAITDPFLSNDVPDVPTALSGACDIAAEVISDNAIVRQTLREKGRRYGKLISEKIKDAQDERQVYEIYYQFNLPIKNVKPHQVLALNRGENEKVLRVNIQIDEKYWRLAIRAQFPPDRRSIFFDQLNAAADDSAKRLLLPSIKRDIRRLLTDEAAEHAISVFSQNLRSLLTQPPLTGHIVLGIDPGFRTGSKVVVVDPTGKHLDKATIYPHPPQKKVEAAYEIVNALIQKYNVSLIVIGNGTASRETELFIAEITRNDPALNYIITSEAGASVYSASKLARKEFPELDVSIRGAVSIARRVQDPLAELVKIDPKSIGVGMYQHDVNQNKLAEALDAVVESVVNTVGVDVNTASAALLTHVAGIGSSLADKIINFREENGPYPTRDSLREVPGMGPKSFEQSAGFLRISNGEEPLDATAIHPESYPVAAEIFTLIKLSPTSDSGTRLRAVQQYRESENLEYLAGKLTTGLHTLEDILNEIARPGRDPREDLPKPLLRKDVLSMDDLVPGMQLKGTIRNVVDFGVFIDIGVKTDGLLHRSKISKGRQMNVGDIIDVVILSVDNDRHRIALEMKESER